MVSLWNGYRTWTMQSVLTGREKDRKVLQLNAALSAEETVADVIKESVGCPVFLRKRVFVAQDNHNREIDLVAIADRVLVIEVKHWSGSVWRNGFRWYQLPFKAPRPLEFEDIFSEAKYKTDALRRHLENDHKILLEPDALVSCLVFSNPKVKLDPNTVANMENVYTLETFQAYMATLASSHNSSSSGLVGKVLSPSVWYSWATSLLPSVLGGSTLKHKPLPQSTKDHIEMALGKVRTWDTIVLHNGTLIHGDIVAVECPTASAAYQRYHVVDIQIQWSEPTVWGLATSLWNGTAGTIVLVLTAAKQRPKKNEQKPRDKDGNLVFPIIMPSKQASSDMRQVDRVLVKRAGTPAVEPIAISTIRQVTLSQHMQTDPKTVVS